MLVTYFVNFRQLNDHLFGKELFIRFAASAFRKLPSVYVFSYFPFGFEGRMWDLIVSVPDHCLSFYFSMSSQSKEPFWKHYKPHRSRTAIFAVDACPQAVERIHYERMVKISQIHLI